jgi:hypothetical protein
MVDMYLTDLILIVIVQYRENEKSVCLYKIRERRIKNNNNL